MKHLNGRTNHMFGHDTSIILHEGIYVRVKLFQFAVKISSISVFGSSFPTSWRQFKMC